MILSRYLNGNILTTLYADGTRIRCSQDDEFRPAFAENVDVQTSNRCNHGCSMCYANCTPDGAFGKLSGWKFLDTLHPGTEMAVNLNFPVADDFVDFLRYIKSKGVFANVTINQDHFMSHEEYIQKLYEEDLIHGLGISLTRATNDFVDRVKNYPNAVIHVINGIFNRMDYEALKDNGLKILILGYKNIGRGVQYVNEAGNQVRRLQNWLYDHLEEVTEGFSVTSFDNLALEQLNVKRLLSDAEWEEFYGGDDGTFTFFINLVDGYFAKNSLSNVHYEIGDNSMDDMFKIVRSAA